MRDKINEAYEKMINEKVVEVRATLESIDDYLGFFKTAMKSGNLKGDMSWGKTKLKDLIKQMQDIIKNL
jgi:hypothetical protein